MSDERNIQATNNNSLSITISAESPFSDDLVFHTALSWEVDLIAMAKGYKELNRNYKHIRP